MPRLRESTRLERRQRILGAAAECLLDKGLHDTTMADIAGRAGLAPPSLYGHFPSKQVLVAAVAQATMRGLVEELDAPGVPLAPADLVVRVIREAAGRRPRLAVLLQMIGEAGRDEELRLALAAGAEQELLPMFRRSLAHHAAGGEASAEQLTPVVLSLVLGSYAQLTVLPGFDADAYCRTVAAVLRAAAGTSGPAGQPAGAADSKSEERS